jgi:hypothetical protein
MKNQRALMYTRELLEVLTKINTIYEEARETKKEYDFYNDIEPFANETYELAKQWKKEVEEVIASQQSHFFGERQLDQVVDNISTLSAQAFQYMTSYKRFKDYHQSTKFLLTTIERQLK